MSKLLNAYDDSTCAASTASLLPTVDRHRESSLILDKSVSDESYVAT
jgi:hypothetical protein